MPVPDYQTLMLPLLKIAGDGAEHTLAEVVERLAQQFALSDEDRSEQVPSGTQTKLHNRVSWARTYMKKAGLLENAGRGKSRITQLGLEVLKSSPTAISAKFLRQFPSFVEFQKTSKPLSKPDEANGKEDIGKTPLELLEESHQTLMASLSEEVLERAKKCSPSFFEKLVVDLLVAMGYGGSRKDAGEAVGHSGDGGIDGIIKEDKLGLDVVYVQAKRWESTVGRPVVQAFAGALMGKKARKGVMITTSQFSKDARVYASTIEQRIVLIDGDELAKAMIDHNIGVSQVETYVVKRIDSEYFDWIEETGQLFGSS